MAGFRISGVLRAQGSGRPLADLLVRAYDRDLVRDDHLGDALSDASGAFCIEFDEAVFRDLAERRPDVYLRVFDRFGQTELLSTLHSVRWNAGEEEHFELEVPRSLLA